MLGHEEYIKVRETSLSFFCRFIVATDFISYGDYAKIQTK